MSTSLNIEGVVGHPVGFLNITTYCSPVKYVRCQTTTGVLINLEMLDVISSNDMGTYTYGKHESYLNYTGTYNCTAENKDGITTGSEFDVIMYGGLYFYIIDSILKTGFITIFIHIIFYNMNETFFLHISICIGNRSVYLI